MFGTKREERRTKKKALPGQLHLFSRRGDNIKTFTEAIVDRASGVSPPLSERAERKKRKTEIMSETDVEDE